MPVVRSNRIGPYEVICPIGVGGMGEVWKARDTRLDRIVAIKFVKGEFAERFDREARAVAALNHPGICTLHDVGPDYLVMEYVEGKPLQGPVTVSEALRLSIQIADALDAAHREGIVHRDLKPANILVTKTGVKLLDFGLAKFQGAVAADGRTMTMALTGKGEILGTLHYMSPEQLQGGEADVRSDIFSFGLILYELLTGRRGFEADNSASLVAAILKEQPQPLEKLVPRAPATLGRLISRALEKDSGRRWQSIRDMIWVLESIQLSDDQTPVQIHRIPSRRSWIAIATVLLIAAAGSVAIVRRLQDAPDGSIGRMSVTPLVFEDGRQSSPLFSPDAKSITYSVTRANTFELFVRTLNSQNAVQIAECPANCVPIGWSPDGARVYYYVNVSRPNGGEVAVAAASGGSTQVVMRLAGLGSGRSIAISPDDRALVFGRLRSDGRWELVTSSPPGADAKPLPAFEPTVARIFTLRFSPDGRSALAQIGQDLVVVTLPDGRSSVVETGVGSAAMEWLPDSRHIVYVRTLVSPAEVVLRDTHSRAARILMRTEASVGGLTVSADGARMVYDTGKSNSGISEAVIESGSVRPLLQTPVGTQMAQYAPSGKQTVYVERITGRNEIFVRDIESSRVVPLTFGNPVGSASVLETRSSPSFSHDGRRIAFSQSGQIWTLPVSGGRPVPITPAGENAHAPAWSSDGRWIYYQRGLPGKRQLVKSDSAGQGSPIVLSDSAGTPSFYTFTRSTAAGDIAYGPVGEREVRICSSDGTGDRLLAKGIFGGDFDPAGKHFYAVTRDAQVWKLLTLDVPSGRVLHTVLLQESTRGELTHVSVHPDGKRLSYTRSDGEREIWMLENLPRPATGWHKLFSHWIEPVVVPKDAL